MKVSATQKSKTFTPITLIITLETQEEAIELWHRFNCDNLPADYTRDYGEFNCVCGWRIWTVLHDIMKERGIAPAT